MNFPSRGLRLSATTMRNTGLFLAPIRFIRILTGINLYPQGGRLPTTQDALRLFVNAGSKRGVRLFMANELGKPCFSTPLGHHASRSRCWERGFQPASVCGLEKRWNSPIAVA